LSTSAADVENSPEYQALLVAAAGKPERSMGDSVIPAEPPVWSDVRKIARNLLTDPPHLSVLVHLAKAGMYLDGFKGLNESMLQLQSELSNKWEDVVPLADADDPDDPFYERVNYLRELADDPTFLASVQKIPLVEVRGLGGFSSRDIDIAAGKITGTEEDQARCQEGLIRGAFAEIDNAVLVETLEQITAVGSSCNELGALFDERAGSGHGLSFGALQQQVDICLKRVQEYGAANLESASSAIETATESPGSSMPGEPAPLLVSTATNPAGLPDRPTVCASFDQIIHYYQEKEPSSPVPVLAQRARDMVTKSFFDVLEDLAPTEKGNLPALMGVLVGNPLASLISDSYQRFLNGERVAPAEPQGETGIGSGGDSEFADNSGNPAVEDLSGDGEEAADDSEATAPSADDELATNDQDPIAVAVTPSPDQGTDEITEQNTGHSSNKATALQSRADVMNQLNLIEGYFIQHEPSSPIPLIVAEIRKLLPKTFTDLIAEFNQVLNPVEDQVDEES